MRSLVWQVVRFTLVGALNTGTAYGVFAFLILLHVHYTLATFLGGMAGLLVGFPLLSTLVFGNKDSRRIWRFTLVFGLMYLLNIGVQKSVHSALNPYEGGAVATVVCFLLSFGLNRWFVFAAGPGEKPEAFDQSYSSIQIRRSQNFLRRWVRAYYLDDILRYISGPALDIGCGAGDLLARLPPGSVGLEINPAAVEYCRARGLEVDLYDPGSDSYELKGFQPGSFTAVIFTHVIEHMEDAGCVLRTTFRSCRRLGVERVIVTVPCIRGYKFDPTHRTFVDENYLGQQGLLACEGYSLSVKRYFPLNWKWLGAIYTFHELRLVFERR